MKYNSNLLDEYTTQTITTDEDILRINEKVRKKPKDTLTVEESFQIINQAKDNPRNYAIMLLFYHSWQRVGSIVNLNKSDIDWIGEINPEDKRRYHRITIRGAKSNMTYDIYVEEEVILALKKYLDVREKPAEGYIQDNYRRKLYHKDAMFLNGNGERLKARAMNIMMKNYALMSGVAKKKIHTHLYPYLKDPEQDHASTLQRHLHYTLSPRLFFQA